MMEQDRPFFLLRLEYRGDELISAKLEGKELLCNKTVSGHILADVSGRGLCYRKSLNNLWKNWVGKDL